MTVDRKIKLTIEVKGHSQIFEGDVDNALKFVSQFLSQTYPGLKQTSKFIYSPDITTLLELTSEYIKVDEKGTLLFVRHPESTEQAIVILLLAAMISHKIGIRNEKTLSINEIIQQVDKAPKTIRNTFAYLTKNNLVERVSKGEYQITVRGVKWMEDVLKRSETSK